jgi:hypothetical protein
MADIDGEFTFPPTAGISIQLGTTITITWTLENPKTFVNLWMSQYDHDNIAEPIVSKYSSPFIKHR